ncbi:MAG: membrane-associated protease 1 [Defluviitaleaceae bacterium]|nr:membrane-associated protease 1 [Defluviitaleaceae bacterium]
MGLRLKIEGADAITLDEHSIISCDFMTDTPDDSNARSSDVVNTMIIRGKILTAVDGKPADDTMKISKWSLVRAEVADSYRKATIEVVVASQIVRKVHFPQAFIVDYTEKYFDTEGAGTFELTIRQKKDLFDLTTVEGGYGV